MIRFTRIPLAVAVFSVAGGSPAAPQTAPEDVVQALTWRNIGPANMGGRIVDIEAVEGDFRRVWLATASGGVWHSDNAGTTWTPIFDRYETASIGDIAVFQPDPAILWVGTGEANNRNSVGWGNGVYKSTDGGATFVNVGLQSTHQIARVVTHPTNPDVAYVAAIGHLWGYSGDRGLFQTTDGGRTWRKLTTGLPDDGRTGATDLVMDPTDPNTLYVAFYHRLRRPWTFHSGGPNGGIFKSTDGGATWRKLTTGLPSGDTGRIGLAIARQRPNVVMALVEAERTDDLSRPGSGVYRSEDGGASWSYVNTYNNRPFYYSQIRINPLDDQRVYLLTTRFMVSEDGGRTLRNGSPDEEIHGDFHAMWLDPTDADRYYIGEDKGPFLTHDHGQHFLMFDNIALGQYYRIGVDMRDPYYVYGGLQDNGTWGGPSFHRDARGILSDKNWKLHWGDGMHIAVDPTDWRTLYTTAENGSFRRYDVVTHRFDGGRPSPVTVTNYRDYYTGVPDTGGRYAPFRFNWTAPLVMSPHDPGTLYGAGNHLFRSTDGTVTWTIMSPDLSAADPAKIVEGQSGGITPDNSGAETHGAITTVAESPVTPGVIWVGTDDGNVQLTRDGGGSWTNLRDRVPDVPDGIWVSRIEASHFDAGRAYLAFDGHRSDVFEPWVFRTDDYGRNWRRITQGLPDGHTVHVVREDLVNPNLVFVGTEFGLFVSWSGGAQWVRLMENLPTVAVRDLVIHPRDHDLVAGTHGRSIWILDDITPLQQLSPEVLASDGHLFDQRRATVWENVSRGGQRGHHWFAGTNPPTIENTSSIPRARFRNTALISYYLGTGAADVSLEIATLDASHRHTVSLPTEPGTHRYRWNLEFDPPPLDAAQRRMVAAVFDQTIAETPAARAILAPARARFNRAETPAQQRAAIQVLTSGFFGNLLGEEYATPSAGPGTYRVTLTVNGQPQETTLVIREDPMVMACRVQAADCGL